MRKKESNKGARDSSAHSREFSRRVDIVDVIILELIRDCTVAYKYKVITYITSVNSSLLHNENSKVQERRENSISFLILCERHEGVCSFEAN